MSGANAGINHRIHFALIVDNDFEALCGHNSALSGYVESEDDLEMIDCHRCMTLLNGDMLVGSRNGNPKGKIYFTTDDGVWIVKSVPGSKSIIEAGCFWKIIKWPEDWNYNVGCRGRIHFVIHRIRRYYEGHDHFSIKEMWERRATGHLMTFNPLTRF